MTNRRDQWALASLLSVSVLAGGCATVPAPLTLDQWGATLTREYPGKSRHDVIRAAEALWRLSDGSDYTIQPTQDGVQATRTWSAFALIVAVSGVDTWRMSVTEEAGAAIARISLSTQTQDSGAILVGSVAIPNTSTTAGAPVDGTAIYDVFWSRMDYLLGTRPDWMTCAESNSRVSQRIVWGANDALCNSFNVLDRGSDSTAPRPD